MLSWIANLSKRFASERQGAAAIEFAFVGPILIALIVAVMDGGRMYFVRSSLQYAADQGTRLAGVNATMSEIDVESAVRASLSSFNSEALDVNALFEASTATTPRYVTVTATFQLDPLFPLFPDGLMIFSGQSRRPVAN